MQISIIILAGLAGLSAAVPGLQVRQTCAIPNVGCYGNNDCCGGLSCDFSESCCVNSGGDDFDGDFGKRQNCGCCR